MVKRVSKRALAVLAAAVVPVLSQSAMAVSGVWLESVVGTYNWSDGTRWTSGTIADGAGFNAAFNNVGGGNIITTLDTARTIGGISRGGAGTGTQANWTITSAANSLTLDNGGSNVNISNAVNAISLLTIDTDIVLNSNLVLTANGNNNSGITLGSAVGGRTISGARNITIASSSGFGNGAITINDNISTSGAITNSSTGTGGGAVVIAGIIGPLVTGVTQNSTIGSLTLTGANTYAGATTVGAAGSASSGRTLTVSGAAGSISASSGYTINGSGSQLNLDYVGVAAGAVDRVGNATAVTLNLGGELRMNGTTTAATNSTESFGTLTLGTGTGIVTINNGGSGASIDTLTASGFARGSNFATALVRGSSLGTSTTAASRLVLTSQAGLTLIGTSTSAAGNDTGVVLNLTIVPYLIGATSASSVGSNFVTYDTSSGLRRLGSTEQAPIASAATGTNVRTLAGANAVTGAKVFNSLLLSSGGTGATPGTATSSVTGDGNSLTLTSGALANVATTATGNVTVSGFSSIIFGNAVSNEAVITNTNVTAGGNLTISSPIDTFSAGGGLTKSGAGNLILSASNLYTGQTTVNQGTLQLGDASALSTTSGLVMVGGTTLTPIIGGNVTISAPITVGGTVRINTTTAAGDQTFTNTLTLGGAIGGTGNVIFSSSLNSNVLNNVFLTAQSNYAGSTLLDTSGGTASQIIVRLGINDALPTTTIVTIDGQTGTGSNRVAEINLFGFSQTLAGLTNTVRSLRSQRVVNSDASAAATLTINGSTNTTFSGALGTSGAGFSVSAFAIPGSTNGNNFGLTKNGTGTFTLTGGNTFYGTTLISGGILSLGAANALSQSPLDTLNSIAGNAANGLRATVTTLTLGGLTGNKNFADVFTTTSGGYTSLTALALNPVSGASHSYSGDIGDGSGSLTLTKSGLGTQILTGASTYTGATAVNAGTLRVNGSLALASAVTVNSGGTLGGIGTIGGTVTVLSGGTIAPGNSIGTLSTGALTLGGTYVAEIDATANGVTPIDANSGTIVPGQNDVISVTGTVDLTGSTLSLDLLNIPEGPNSNTYVLILNDDIDAVTGTFANFLPSSPLLTYSINYAYNADAGSVGNDVAITFTSVPEPTSLALLGLGSLGLLFRRRRSSLKRAAV